MKNNDDVSGPPIGSRLSAIIPTLNEAENLGSCLRVIASTVGELIVVDGGSSDNTASVASHYNARWLTAKRGRGSQLAAGGAAATGDWLLFIHADTVLQSNWERSVHEFINEVREDNIAGVFRYRNDLHGLAGRVLERYVAWRTSLGLPYGDQCLLISRSHYHRLGGFSDFPIMEDIEFARRIGRRGLRVLPVLAVTSGVRYRSFGIFCRGLRNLFCLALYFIGLPPRLIAKIYG